MTKTDRINSQIQKELSALVSRELRDPRVKGLCSVLSVDTDKEQATAKVYVSFLGSKDQTEAVAALNHSAGYIRNLLKPRLRMRNVPEFKFFLDKSAEHSQKIAKILNDLNL